MYTIGQMASIEISAAYNELFNAAHRLFTEGDRQQVFETVLGQWQIRARLLGPNTLHVIRAVSAPSEFRIDTIFDATHPPQSFSDPNMILQIARTMAELIKTPAPKDY